MQSWRTDTSSFAGHSHEFTFLSVKLQVVTGPEPPILDWYGHCVRLSANKLGGSGGMHPQENFSKLATLRSLLRPCLGQNTTRISPPVALVAREAIETQLQEMTATHDAHVSPSPICARSSRAQVPPWKIEKPQFSRRYFGCLKA